MQKNNWYQVKNSDEIITPGLLVYPDRIKQNIESMISVSGTPDRLIPHVKTYKMKEIVKFAKMLSRALQKENLLMTYNMKLKTLTNVLKTVSC